MHESINAQHNTTFFEIDYRNHVITRITCFYDGSPGRVIEYDDLSLSERETILIAIIEYLKQK